MSAAGGRFPLFRHRSPPPEPALAAALGPFVDVLLEPDAPERVDGRNPPQVLGRAPVIDEAEQVPPVGPDRHRERLALPLAPWEVEAREPSAVAVRPLRRRHASEPLGGGLRQRVQGVEHGLADEFEPVQLADRREHVGRVRPLATPRLDEPPLLEQVEQALKKPLFGRAVEEPLPELGEHTEVEAGVLQVQAQRVLPVEPGADGVGGLAVGEVLGELEDGDEGEPPRGRGRLADIGVEVGEVVVAEERAEPVAGGEVGVPLGEGGPGDASGLGGDGEVGLGAERHSGLRSD